MAGDCVLASRTFLSMVVAVVVSTLMSSSDGLRFLGQPETYARYPKWNACPNASLSFEFRTSQPTALLLYTDDNGRYDYLQLALTKGSVRLWINFVAEENRYVDIEANTEPLNDGRWHLVEIRRNRMETVLLVDGTQTSKVALGSDFEFGRDPAQNNYVYFGGVPSSYANNLRGLALPSAFFSEKFRGDVRNILYFNCSCIPVRASLVEGQGVTSDPREACEVRNPCEKDCPCISADDGPGCRCTYKRECLKDTLVTYHLPMDEIKEQTVLNPSGLDSVVEGEVKLTPGVRRNALEIDGRSQWLRVTGAAHRLECMGDLARCDKGYYLGMWLQFRDVGYQRGVYLSNGGHSSDSHGVAFFYSKGKLEVVFKMADGREWRVRSNNVLEDRWYHVAVTWSQEEGLHLYVNGERVQRIKTPTKRQSVTETSRFNGFYIGRANDNTGTERLGRLLVDDFVFVSAFKNEKEVKESGAIYHYYLPLDEIQKDNVTGEGLTRRVYGPITKANGKVAGALSFPGSRSFVDMGDMAGTCIGDLDLCEYGLYVSFWVSFSRLDSGPATVLSAPSIRVYQNGSQLVASARKSSEVWETRFQSLQPRAWYFVELSWQPNDGLRLYVNRMQQGHQLTAAVRPLETRLTTHMYMGRDDPEGRRYPSALVDEMDIFYADRDTLLRIDFIERERPTNMHFTMDDVADGRLVHDSMPVALLGRPTHMTAMIGNGLLLDGQDDVLDFGVQGQRCFGNLDLCPHGMTLSLWLRPDRLQDRSYFLSTGNNGLSMSYADRKLQVTAATTTHTWTVSTADFPADKWHFLEVSFHPEKGLRLYDNGRLVAESSLSDMRNVSAPASQQLDRFYVGRGNVDMTRNRHAPGLFDELDVWYADRDYLTSHGFLQRSRPENIIVHFEESPDRTRITHPTLDIRLIGRPELVPGKIGNALELRGRGQYANLGMLGSTCMGNLALCTQGITLSAWMKFRSFENDMVFLSTGQNGLLMLYRDGYIHVSADGRGLVTARRFDTDRWYHVEISWHPNYGLRLYVDNQLVAESPPITIDDSGRPGEGHFYIGRPNDGAMPGNRYTTGNFDIDELEVWYGRREDLVAFNYINRDAPGYEAFSMDSAVGTRLDHSKYVVLLVNGARLEPGHVGQAVVLDGRGQYVDLGEHLDSCLGNLDLCPHGFTMSLWLKPGELRDNIHFLAAPSYALFYEDGELKAEFSSEGRVWTVATPNFRSGEWQRVTLAWHAKKGLTLFVNDELMNTSSGVERTQADQPASGHVYLGRNLADARLTADVQADELQVWYDYLDQLRSTGKYEVQTVPRLISFDNWNNDRLILRDRVIYAIGELVLVPGLGQGSTAVYLDGRTKYIDLGSNFTCNGNLDTCRQGATIRLALKPNQLVDGTYFIDSFPVKVYYKDGRIYAEMQTSTRVWQVNSADIQPGQWARLELSWHPTYGLTMYVNGQRVGYQTFPRERAPVTSSDWRSYLGRPLNDGEGNYANVLVDNLEFYNAYRNYIPPDSYLSLLADQTAATTERSIIHGELGRVTTQRPPLTQRPKTTTTIINLDGASYVSFNFGQLPAEYLTFAQEEEFSLLFLTNRSEGLLWYHQEPRRNLYLAMKDGHLVFVNDNKSGSPEEVHIGRRDGKRFNDYRWHKLNIRRSGRRIRITVDDSYPEEYIFSENVQFLVPAVVWLGGTDNTVDKTRGNIRQNFQGGVAEIVYVTEQKTGERRYRNEVNLITQLSSGSASGRVEVQTIPSVFTDYPSSEPIYTPTRAPPTRPPPTRPPQPQMTAVTFTRKGAHVPVSTFKLRDGYSITFKFQTISQNGLLLYADIPRGNYFAVELVDGRLYFVHNFGRRDKRTAFASRIMADGQQHEVEMRFYSNTHVDLRVDDIRERLSFEGGERLPTNAGSLYVAGYPASHQLPWMVWSRESYLGCLEDLQVDGHIFDFSNAVLGNFGQVSGHCLAMPQECTRLRPCVNGVCRNSWEEYFCDCRDVAYRGARCELGAWTALFNGSIWANVYFKAPIQTHVDNMSVRFKSPLANGLLFETSSRDSNVYLRCSLENGRVKVETNLGGEVRTFYTGNNLNDLNWHTLFIQRRGNEMEVWVDDRDHFKQTLAGKDYFFSVDHLSLGGVDPDGGKNKYIGYLQNFYLNDLDILDDFQDSSLIVDVIDRLPPLLYHAVTFPQFDTFIQLPPLRLANITVLHFMFRTEESSGILLLAVGKQADHLVVELFDGKMEILVNGFKITNQQPLNDNKWHAVTIQRAGTDQRQFFLTVDGVTSSFVYPIWKDLFLDEALYIGGVPQDVLQRDYIKQEVSSRSGFRGCLASVDLSGQVPDLTKFAREQRVTIYDTCQDVPVTICTNVSCENFGFCITSGSGAFTCDCTMSAHAGTFCTDHPIGYRFQNLSQGGGGLLVYTFRQPSTYERDEIAFGVMTKQKAATLIRIFSETFKDFITFKLVDGRIVAEYDTNAEGGSLTVYGEQVNDGKYHIIRFMRGPDKAELHVDRLSAIISTHPSKHGNFDGVNKIYVGGSAHENSLVQNGFDGIIGGLTLNGLHIFQEAVSGRDTQLIREVRVADRPFRLEERPTTVIPIQTTPSPTSATAAPTVFPAIIPVPADVGGGGVGWIPNAGGIVAEVYPGGHGGTGVVVPGPYIPINDPLVGAQVAAPPPLPASGPRAGAVMGTILGLLALASSMMWAFYRCKPGWCTCLKPHATPSLNISSPRASGTNKPLLSAVGGGSGAGSGAASSSAAGAGGAGGAGAGGAGGAGGGGSFSNFYLSQTSSSSGAGGAGAGGGGGESYDTATLRATGTFSNKGTVIGTPKPARAHLGSTASGVSGGGYSSTYTSQVRSASESATDGPGLTPASIQSYHYESGGGGTADYDLVTGVSSNYQSNTLTAGERGLGGSSAGYSGGFGGAAGYSTMSSSYNYSVKTVRTVSGQQQMVGYAGAPHIGVPPGALGEEVRVDCCLMTNDGHSVITGSSLGPPQVWDMQTGELLRIMRGETVGSTNLHLACNDRLLVGAINADLEVNQSSIPKGVHNYLLQIWDFSTGQALEMADLEVCSALAMMSDNDKVVFARSDKFGGGTNVVVWDLLGNQPIKHMRFDAPIGNNDYVHFLALSQNDRYVIAGFTNSFDNFAEFVVFDMTLTSYTVSDPSILRLDASPECTAVLPRDEAVTGLRNGDLVIWSLRTGQPSRQLLSGSGRHAHSREIKALARSEDNKFLVSASADGTLKVWDIETERHINTLNGHTDEVWCCAVSSDNEIVVSGSRDRTIRLWRLKSGTEICNFNAGVDIFHVTMSRDKSVIVALGDKMGARKLIMLQVVRTKVRRQISS